MSKKLQVSSASFGKLFLAFSMLLLLVLFYISMQTSEKLRTESLKTIEQKMAAKLDYMLAATTEEVYAWNAFNKLINVIRKNEIESNEIENAVFNLYFKSNISAKVFIYKNNELVKSFNHNKEDLKLFTDLLKQLTYSRGDPEYIEANRKPHKMLIDLLGNGGRLELVKLHKNLQERFLSSDTRQYYYWNTYENGLGVFIYTTQMPDFIQRFKNITKQLNESDFGAIDSKQKIISPSDISQDQTLAAYLKSIKANTPFVDATDYYWYFLATNDGNKICYTLPTSANDFLDWAGYVENISALIFLIVVLLYLTSLLKLAPGHNVVTIMDNSSIKFRISGIFAMASIFPVMIAFILGASTYSDKKTVIEKAILSESLNAIYSLENQYEVLMDKTRRVSADIREAIKTEPVSLEMLYKYLDKYSLSHDLVKLEVKDSNTKPIFTMDDSEINGVGEILNLVCRIVLKLHNPERLNLESISITPGELLSESVFSTDELGFATIIRQRAKQWLFKVGIFPTTWYWDVYPEIATGPAFMCLTTQIITTYQKQIEDYLSIPHVGSDSLQLYAFISDQFFNGGIYPNHEKYISDHELLNIADTAFRTHKVIFRNIDIQGVPYWITAKAESNVGNHVFLHLICQNERLKVLEPFKWQLIFGCLFALIISLIGAGFIINLIILPVGDLSRGITAIRKRNKDFSIPVRRKDEFGKLAVAFNRVLSDLEELEYGKIVQESLLPREPEKIEGYDIAYFHISATDLAGDYHDNVLLEDGRLAIVLGDVTGHGISASLAMAMAKGTFNYARDKNAEFPGELIDMLNTMFNKELKPKNKFMTLLSVVLTPETGEIVFDNAGQAYPCYYSAATQTSEEIKMPSMPLGAMKKRKKRGISRIMEPGDAFILYTDGIIESSAANGEMYGYNRFYNKFTELMKANIDSAKAIKAIYDEVENYREPGPHADDITMIILRRKAYKKTST